jgi:SpoU rRNA methylase family enzyme
MAALGEISRYFVSEVQSVTEARRRYQEENGEVVLVTELDEVVRVSSQVALSGVRYAASWFDKSAGEWQTVGYIDREEVLGLYDQRIQGGMGKVRHLAAPAEGAEALSGVARLYQALGLAKAIEADVMGAQVLAAGRSDAERGAVSGVHQAAGLSVERGRYASVLEELSDLGDAYRALKAEVTLGVTVEVEKGAEARDRAFSERIGRQVQAVLEGAGFVVAGEKGGYTVTVKTTQVREDYEAGIFVRCGVLLRIDGAGKTLFSYTRNYDRRGHRTLEGAYNRAALHIEDDLEAHLVGALLDTGIGE